MTEWETVWNGERGHYLLVPAVSPVVPAPPMASRPTSPRLTAHARIRRALTADWQHTGAIAAQAGEPANQTSVVLGRLMRAGLAERRRGASCGGRPVFLYRRVR